MRCPTAQGQSALVPHLKDCKECSEEWTLLNSLEDLLRGEDLISPSPHFEQRVSAQLSTESRRRQQSWQHPFLVVMAMISGLGFVAAGSLFVMSGLQPAAFFGQAIGLVQALSTAFISTIWGARRYISLRSGKLDRVSGLCRDSCHCMVRGPGLAPHGL